MGKIFLTGRPGSGKSTVLMKVIDILKKKGFKVGGFITPEIREGGRRTGFKVIDIHSGEEGILAKVCTGVHGKPRLGKYCVFVKDFERVALPALDFAVNECDVCVIDEIGKLEFFSNEFKENIHKLAESDTTLVSTLHRCYAKEFEKFGELINVTYQNRNELPKIVVNKIIQSSSLN